MAISNDEIRKYLGHSLPECRVRISKSGAVSRYGSPNLFDRSFDFWISLGNTDDISDQILREQWSSGWQKLIASMTR